MNIIQGNNQNNNLQGGDLADYVIGLGGSDSLNGGPGENYLDGGFGFDRVDYTLLNAKILYDTHSQKVISALFADTLADIEYIKAPLAQLGDTITAEDDSMGVFIDLNPKYLTENNETAGFISRGDSNGKFISGFENIIGSAFDDTLIGDSSDNRLIGGSGDDILQGGAGVDFMMAGKGYDIYFVDNIQDEIVELPDEDVDLIQSSVTYTLPVNVENLTLVGANNIDGSGNSLNNFLAGNAGNNILNGYAGADILMGGEGNDIYIIDALDEITEWEGEGSDSVISSENYILGNNFENLFLIGSKALKGVGNELNNEIRGNGFDNELLGGAGDDKLYAGDGADILNGGLGDDFLAGGAGDDELFGEIGSDLFFAGLGNDFVDGGSDADRVFGGAGNDELEGGAGNDKLYGEGGDDVLNGGLGDDFLAGREGRDLLKGFDGKDLFFGNQGSDEIFGGSGDDMIYAGEDNDWLWGDEDNDYLYGEAGNDVIFGGTGDDLLAGGAGSDLLDAGEGNNILIGDEGKDQLQGGSGEDIYKGFKNNFGEDIILDAGGTNDLLDLAEYKLTDLSFVSVGTNLTINIDGSAGQGSIIIRNFFDENNSSGYGFIENIRINQNENFVMQDFLNDLN